MRERIRTHTDLARENAKAITEQLVEQIEARHQRSRENAKGRGAVHLKSRKQRRAERKERRAACSRGKVE